jgi:hypothetical protein
MSEDLKLLLTQTELDREWMPPRCNPGDNLLLMMYHWWRKYGDPSKPLLAAFVEE